MALPGNLNTITVTGTYVNMTGVAQTGTVSFAPTSTVTDAAGATILTTTPVVVPLNSSGSFSQVLPCTDTPGLTPLGFGFTITVAVGGAQQTLTPVYLPHTLGATVDMSVLGPGPVTSPPAGIFYLPNAPQAPTGGPSVGGGFLYASNGALFWTGGGGTTTKIAGA